MFAGGFGLDAAEAVCVGVDLEEADVMDVLSRLIDKSLVPPGDRSGGRTRYRLLETIREYAGEQAEGGGRVSGDPTSSRRALPSVAEAGEVALRGAAQSEWLRRLDQELDNFRAALAWAQEEDPALDYDLRLLWSVTGSRAGS